MADRQHPTDWLSSSNSASQDGPKRPWARRHKTALAVAFAGVVAGGVLVGTLGASAATVATSSGAPAAYGAEGTPPVGEGHGPRPARGDEKPLSASITAALKAKALAAVPGGTVDRVESASGEAAYEAHVTKADGSKVTVTFDKSQKVLAVEAGRGKGDPRGAGTGCPGGSGGRGPEGVAPPAGARPGGSPESGAPGV